MELTTKPILEMTAAELMQLAKQKEAVENHQQNQRKVAYAKDKEIFLKEVSSRFNDAQGILETLKTETITHSENFNSLKYELEGKAVKEAKSFELKNDTIKIVVESQDRVEFNDQAIVHINAIKDIFRAKFELRNKGFYNLLDRLLMKNTQCDYDPKLLIKVRKEAKELNDDNLLSEIDKLNDCLIVVGSAKYCRVYTKDDKNRWKRYIA
jgi:hypothetical protein